MVVVTSPVNLVISSFPDNGEHDGSNNEHSVRSNMHVQACLQHCSSWPAQPCSSLSTGKKMLCILLMYSELLQILPSDWLSYWSIRRFQTITKNWHFAEVSIHLEVSTSCFILNVKQLDIDLLSMSNSKLSCASLTICS